MTIGAADRAAEGFFTSFRMTAYDFYGLHMPARNFARSSTRRGQAHDYRAADRAAEGFFTFCGLQVEPAPVVQNDSLRLRLLRPTHACCVAKLRTLTAKEAKGYSQRDYFLSFSVEVLRCLSWVLD
jgi:hypothetical protein